MIRGSFGRLATDLPTLLLKLNPELGQKRKREKRHVKLMPIERQENLKSGGENDYLEHLEPGDEEDESDGLSSEAGPEHTEVSPVVPEVSSELGNTPLPLIPLISSPSLISLIFCSLPYHPSLLDHLS